jgi:magnesium-protoporphyrin O-methyltransferase
MHTETYLERRGRIQTYFDRTAADTWSKLTSDAPVGRIRATVRAGRDQMRRTILDWLPADLRGRRLLDAGCGTGALAVEAAQRGAEVVAVDLSPTLVALAQERRPKSLGAGSIEFHVGDMLDAQFGSFDHVVAMDSLVHYDAADTVRVLAGLASRTRSSMVITFAPRTSLLALMHAIGRLLPHGHRAPAIEPVREATLRRLLAREPDLDRWRPRHTARVSSGFYTSQAMELATA